MKQHTIQRHRTVEKMFDFYCYAGQNANCFQITCKTFLVTKTSVKPCLEFYHFWKITSEKKDMLSIFHILRIFTGQRRR